MQIAKLKDGLFVLLGPYEEKDLIKTAGGRWNSKARRWECGPETAARIVLQYNPLVSSAVRTELMAYAQKYREILALSSARESSPGFDVPCPPLHS